MSLVFEADIKDLKYMKNDEHRVAKASTVNCLLLAYADHANDEGEGAYPGYTRLERKTKLSRQGISNTIDACVQNKLLTFEGKSKRETNSYKLNIDLLSALNTPLCESSHLTSKSQGESSGLTSKSQATLPEGVKPLDHNHPLTIPKPSIGASAPPAIWGVEWQIAAGIEQVALPTEEQQLESRMVNALELFPPDCVEFVRAFITATGIFPIKDDVSGWCRSLKDQQNRTPGLSPAHITAACVKSYKQGMTIKTPFSVMAFAGEACTKKSPDQSVYPVGVGIDASTPSVIWTPELVARKEAFFANAKARREAERKLPRQEAIARDNQKRAALISQSKSLNT